VRVAKPKQFDRDYGPLTLRHW